MAAQISNFAYTSSKAINQTSYLTLEALVAFVADTVTSLTNGLNSITVCGGKPDALSVAEAAEVKITRQLEALIKRSPIPTPEGQFLSTKLASRLCLNDSRRSRCVHRRGRKYRGPFCQY